MSLDDLPAWVGENAIYYINEENIREILLILGRAKGNANIAFWNRINSAPDSDEKWQECVWFGSPIPEDAKKRNLEQVKRAVDIVRRFVGPGQLRRNSLFLRKS